jgi:phosphoribosylanthranilate isomerase
LKSSRKKGVKVKICGLTSKLDQISELDIDYVGFIFYSKSPRFVVDRLSPEEVSSMPSHIQKVGVFVNEKPEQISQLAVDYQLDFVQLHGNESPDFCQDLQQRGMRVIKAFGIGDQFDFNLLKPYIGKVSFFLFDTATASHGGSGKAFDWSLLKRYPFEVPIFVGGGVGPENLESLLSQDIPHLYAVDMNSKLEISPGLKDIAKARAALTLLKDQAL